MNDRAKVEVPIRWILGDPEEYEELDPKFEWMEIGDHFRYPDVRAMLESSGVEVGESGCYTGDLIADLAIKSRIDLDDVVAVVYRYHDWIEVLVLKSRATGRDVVAYLVMGNDEYHGSSLADIEPEVVRAMTHWAFIESVAM